MSWFSSFFYWTALSRGIRHGKRGKPNEDHFIYIDMVKQDIDLLKEILSKLKFDEKEEAKTSDYTPTLKDDYEEGIAVLREVFKKRGIPMDNFLQDKMVCLINALADIVKLSASQQNENIYPDRISFYEHEQLDLAEKDISKVCEKWDKKKHELEAKAKKIRHHLADVKEEYEKFHKRHEEKEFRLPARGIPKWLYIPLMCIIGVSEFAFNAQVFRILNIPLDDVYLIALAPSIGFPSFAHFLGTKMRQGLLLGEKSKRSISAIVISSICILIGLLAVANLRGDYLKSIGASADIWQNISMLALNLFFLGAAIILAYTAHDPDKDLETIFDHKKRLRRKLNSLWKAWNKVATEFDELRGITINRIQQIREETRAVLAEYRLGVSLGSSGGSIQGYLQGAISDRLFTPRYIGHELDLSPPPLDKIIPPDENISEEQKRR